MKYNILIILFINLFISCNSPNSKSKDINSDFEKSFKESNDSTFVEHYDSITNIYSNFKYYVAFDGPDKWKFDAGVSEHTIYRTFEPDSAISFSINVIEIKENTIDKDKITDLWSLYQQNKEQMDNPIKQLIEEQLNTKLEDFQVSKTNLKNNIALRRSSNYMTRNLNYEYSNTLILYQTLIKNLTFTFSLNVPTIFYEENPTYYEELFNNVYFLKNTERLNQILNNKNK